MNNFTQSFFTFCRNSFKKSLSLAVLLTLLVGSLSYGQTNPVVQTLPYTQNFGTALFTTMPAGTVAWNGLDGSAVNTQTSAQSSVPTGNPTIQQASVANTTGGSYGFMTASNACYYVQTSGNNGNGVNQLATAINTGVGITSVNVSYDIRVISSQTAIMGVVLQYRPGTTGSWTTVAGSALSYNSSSTNGADADTAGDSDSYSYNVSGLTASTAYQFRWATWKGAGTGTGLGFDNLNFSAGSPTITSAGSGNWSVGGTWVGGSVPSSTDNVIIAAGHVVTLDSSTGGINTRNSGTTTTVNSTGTLATSVQYINNGTTTINGTFQLNAGGFTNSGINFVYGATGTLNFNNTSSYGVNDTDQYWPTTSGPFNVTVLQGGMTLNTGVNRTVNGTFQTAAAITLTGALTLNGTARINTGGAFANAPIYGNASTLIYNTGATFGRGNEWTTATSGAGYPANVQISNPGTVTTLNMGTTSAQCSGSITVDAGTILNTTSAGLLAIGSVSVNGTISLGGDVTTQGNWTIGTIGVQNNNGKAVFFTAPTGSQTITKNPSGIVFFDYLIINKAAGNVVLSASPATNVVINTNSGNVLQLLNAGSLDLNGRTLTFNNNDGNIFVDGAGRTIISSVPGGTLAIAGNKFVRGPGTLITSVNVTISATFGIGFDFTRTTVNGTFQINTGGFAFEGPIYGPTSTLIYNGVSNYGAANEWTGNASTAGLGTPQNVTLINSSVILPNTARSLAGNLVIGSGSTLNLNGVFGADLNISGNFTNSGTFNPNNRAVFFRGTSAQTLTGATTFDFLTLDNAAGLTLQASSAVTVNQTLALTAGKLTIGANNLTVSGALTGASSTNYVVTNSTGQLRRNVAATAVLFPTGNTVYNPITFTNSGTSDIYGVRVVNGAITTGANNTKTVSRSWVTTEATAGGNNLAVVAQYNTGEENTGFAAAITPYIGFYNGTSWSQVDATLAGANPFTASSTTNSTPADLTTGTQYFAIGKDNAFLSVADRLVITSITPTSPTAGSGFNVTVRSQDAFGAFSSVSGNTNFTLSTNGNAGTIGGTITGTLTAGTNTVTVTGVTLSTAGTGVTLTATRTSGDNLIAGTSASFTVLASADRLAFVGVPTTGNVGVNLTTFTVEARRPDLSVDTFYTGAITIAKFSGTGNLTGTLTVAAVAGVATFNAAQFDAASTYTLIATSGSLTSVTSGNIVVTLAPTVIAQFDFSPFSLPTADDVTIKDTNVSVTDFGISAGTLSVGVLTGTEFPNEPYVAGSGGYTATTQAAAKNFNFTINANIGYKIEVTSFQFNALSTAAGPSAISFNIASGASLFTANAPDTVLLPVNQTVTGVSNLTSIPVLIQGWLNGSRTSAGSGNFRVDDVIVKGYVTCIQPTAYAVTGGGTGCTTIGVTVGLANSQSGISYQLKNGATNVGSPVAGTGLAISFGAQTVAGTYTVVATNTNGTCNLSTTMTGSAVVTLDPISDAGTVSANQAICAGSQPADIILTGSTGAIQWQSSTDNSNFTDISGQTSATLAGATIGAITATTYYRAIVTSGSCAAATSATVTVLIETTTWTSALGGSWDNGTPTSTKSAVISFNYAVPANLSACTLTVNNNAVVTIPSGFNVTLNGQLNVNSGSSFTLSNNANLIQSTDVANAGNIIVKRNSSALKRQDYTLWSSPVAGQNLLNFSPLTLTNRFYTYETNATPTPNVYVAVPSPSSTSFAAGKGYLIRMPNNHPTFATVYTGTFTGIPNNGPVPATLTNAGAGLRFNAVGNPYPSTIDMASFVAANRQTGDERITGTLYFWRKTNSTVSTPGYCTWTAGTFVSNGEAQVFDPNGIIQVGQGFIVEAQGSATELNFNNTMRVGNTANQFFKNSAAAAVVPTETNRIWLNMTSTAGEFSQTAVGYMTNATQGVDAYDGKFFNEGPIAITSYLDQTDYTIQGRALPFEPSDVVPLNVKVTTAGSYSIAIDHVDGLFAAGTQDILLKDNLNGTYTNLNNGSYTFTTAAGTFNNRFELVYQTALSTVNPVLSENNVIVYKQSNNVVINTGIATMASVKAYDMRGRLLVEKNNINASETQLNLGTTNQVVLLQITSTDGVVVTKKVVN